MALGVRGGEEATALRLAQGGVCQNSSGLQGGGVTARRSVLFSGVWHTLSPVTREKNHITLPGTTIA